MTRGEDAGEPHHVFTVDVEEYFQVHAFEDLVQRGEWPAFPSRVELATRRLLGLLDDRDVEATFFVLGWIAERHPGLVRRIADAGHEVASHSMWHHRVAEMGPDGFREDARASKELLEDITGEPVLGYRAPSFSLSDGTDWMLEILAEEGYRYDSSLFPARRPMGGGMPGAKRRPHLVDTPSGPLLELPLTTRRVAGLTLPAAGGAYLRHLPYALLRSGLREAEAAGDPGVVYVHPWELDPEQPEIPASVTARFRHYRNLDRTERLLERLTDDFAFTSARERFGLDRDAGEGAGSAASNPGPGETPEGPDADEVDAADDGRRTRRQGSGT